MRRHREFQKLAKGHRIIMQPNTNTRQYYGFLGIVEYDEELLKELEQDYEESGMIESYRVFLSASNFHRCQYFSRLCPS